MGLALEPPLPRRFGRYELLERIDVGGMGVVYRARETNPDRLVALKMIRASELATPAVRLWFRREAQEASRLEHPNIVTIFRVGDADEPAYYTMRLLTGGTLAQAREALRADSRRVARLVATVARAVHHGHVRGVLHRDLKPANILFDDAGNPHVADFGIAARLDGEEDVQEEALLGTPHYLSPEQAGPPPRQLTTKSDVYSLGVILFELLTGRLPFDGPTAEAIVTQHRSAAPPTPRSLDPKVDLDLDAICLQCLDKNPERRPSAEQLGEELERFLGGEPVLCRPIGRFERGSRWARRHPAAAGFTATAALTVLTLAVAAIALVRAGEVERRKDVLQANAFAARSLAGLVAFQLSRAMQRVEALAADPVLVARLDEPPGLMPPEIDEFRTRESFLTIGFRNTEGMAIARSPPSPDPNDYFSKWWGWPDHFKEAKRRGEQGRHEAYVARPSRSEVTGDYKFTISVPVFGAAGRWRGVVYGSFATDALLGRVRLDDGNDPRRTAALVARPDNDRETHEAPLPEGFVIVVHDGLDRGTTLPVANAALATMPVPQSAAVQLGLPGTSTATTDDYRDPVPGYEGRWLAGLAPVGNTGYVVVVQTRYSAIVDPGDAQLVWLLKWAGLPLFLGALAINLLLFVFRRRDASDRQQL